MKTLAVAIVTLAVITLAAGHGYLTSPTARSGTQDVAKSACSATPSEVVATWNAGATVTVNWKIAINHGGPVTWSLSYDGNPANAVAVGPSTDMTGKDNGDYSAQITLPADKTCDTCLLQWTWDPPTEAPYIGCSTVKIAGVSKDDVFCKSGLVHCNSASTVSFSALMAVFVALLALFL